jgi:hypothetical protein
MNLLSIGGKVVAGLLTIIGVCFLLTRPARRQDPA